MVKGELGKQGSEYYSLRPTVREHGASSMSDADRLRLVFFENLFFQLDEDRSGTIDEDECSMFLSFAALDMSAEARCKAREVADEHHDVSMLSLEL